MYFNFQILRGKSTRQKFLYWIKTYIFCFKSTFYFRRKARLCFMINLPLFSTVLPSNSRLFLSCRPFVVITTFSTGLWVLWNSNFRIQQNNSKLGRDSGDPRLDPRSMFEFFSWNLKFQIGISSRRVVTWTGAGVTAPLG